MRGGDEVTYIGRTKSEKKTFFTTLLENFEDSIAPPPHSPLNVTTLLQITAFSVGITILIQRIILKDDIEFVNEFPCLLGHPVCLRKFGQCTADYCRTSRKLS